MIDINNVSFKYSNSDKGTLNNVTVHIAKGECVLLCGESGCGKTTLTRMINGLIPNYYEGEITGDVLIDGLNVTKSELYETARKVGSVFQNPRSQFFCVDTTSEIAFGCENLGFPEDVVNYRIKEATENLELTELLGRNIFGLSGGEKQKVACASVSAIHPDVFVLDEPTSNLDVRGIEILKKTLEFWKHQGKTIIIAEHRLYWLKDICDRVIYMSEGSLQLDISMNKLIEMTEKQVKELGLRPLNIDIHARKNHFDIKDTIQLKDYYFCYNKEEILHIPSLTLPLGGVIAVIGDNGAGKSTFSKCLCGLESKFKGKCMFAGSKLSRKKMLEKSYMVMQDVNHQLFCESVSDEVRLGMNEQDEEQVVSVLDKLGISELMSRHPMSLSGGQKQRVAIASAILAGKEILIFDEPTSGLDFKHMKQTADLLLSLRGSKTVFVITHDPDLIMRCCDHALYIEKGKVKDVFSIDENTQSNLRGYFNL